jgi:hypothetical protein
MRIEFQRTLFNNTNYDPLAKHPGYLTTFFQLNQEMLAANARIELRHNWESVWWEWPLNLRGLLYYSRDMPGAINRTKVRHWPPATCCFFPPPIPPHTPPSAGLGSAARLPSSSRGAPPALLTRPAIAVAACTSPPYAP